MGVYPTSSWSCLAHGKCLKPKTMRHLEEDKHTSTGVWVNLNQWKTTSRQSRHQNLKILKRPPNIQQTPQESTVVEQKLQVPTVLTIQTCSSTRWLGMDLCYRGGNGKWFTYLCTAILLFITIIKHLPNIYTAWATGWLLMSKINHLLPVTPYCHILSMVYVLYPFIIAYPIDHTNNDNTKNHDTPLRVTVTAQVLIPSVMLNRSPS